MSPILWGHSQAIRQEAWQTMVLRVGSSIWVGGTWTFAIC